MPNEYFTEKVPNENAWMSQTPVRPIQEEIVNVDDHIKRLIREEPNQQDIEYWNENQ